VSVHKWDGTSVEFDRIALNDGALGPNGWVLARNEDGYVLDPGDQTSLFFSASRAGGMRYRLTAIKDRYGNKISLHYENGRLVEIIDSVGRVVRAIAASGGRIASFEVKNAAEQGQWVPLSRYTYDNDGNLISTIDADNYTTSYTYVDHLLSSHTDPTGLTFSFRYDRKHRCVETWGCRSSGDDPSLAATVPKVLADGTKAKGILHCNLEFGDGGYSEAADSIKVQRFFGNAFGKLDKAVSAGQVYSRTYDEHGHLLSFSDALEATTTWERDGRGRILKTTDALGRSTVVTRDPDGQIRRIVEPGGGVTEVTSRPDGLAWTDPIGATFAVKYDARGLVTETVAPNGATTHYRHDAFGNMVEKVDALQGRTQLFYDYFGRCTGICDPLGAATYFTYSARGDILTERHADGGVTRYAYDGTRELTAVTRPSGQTTTFIRGGYKKLCQLRRPNGEVYTFKYDREGRLREVHNPHGEVHFIELNGAGLVVQERTFDGRNLSYKYDRGGNLVSSVNGLGQKTEFVHDLVGQLLSRTYSDGSVDAFEHDEMGNVVRATSGATELLFEWNAIGWLTKETQVIGGEAVAVQRSYDWMGEPVRRATTLGHVAEWTRDIGGRSHRVLLDGSSEITLAHDILGREIGRLLPRGGRIDTAYDPMGRIVRRRVIAPSTQRPITTNEPEWIGPRATGATVDQAYQYSPAREIAQAWDQATGLRRFEYDLEGQLLAVVPEKARAELFRYDAAGNVFETGPSAESRVYGPGNRLLRSGDTEYLWDNDGRLSEARTRSSTGEERARHYRWSAAGLLKSVKRSDGGLVEFMYDAFARRVAKRVSLPAAEGGRSRPATFTRFVWDRSALVHEIKHDARIAGDPVIEERTYCFDEDTGAPWAQRTALGPEGDRAQSDWFHYLNDDLGAPERLIAPDGTVACELQRTAWGRAVAASGAATTTPLRFPGQYEDEETGLSYNRYRYYDPALGRYISSDPVGIYGGFNGFNYADNKPTRLVDPNGLFPDTVVTQKDAKGKETVIKKGSSAGKSGVPDIAHPKDDAVTQAIDNARKNNPDAVTKSHGNCAEIDALHKMAADIRKDRKANGQTEKDAQDENMEVRRELQKKFTDGAKMSTTGSDGGMHPCTSCGQILRELGLHPQSPAAIGMPKKAGVMGQDGKKWDGKLSQQGQQKHQTVEGNTKKSITPPFNE